MTSLTDAITKQNQRIFDICLSSSNLSENELDDALILAVKQKSTECVGKLLKAGADKRVCDRNGNSLIILSVSSNDPKTTKVLLEAGCKIDARGSSRCTALHIAAKRGSDDCLDYLIEFGANVNSRDSSQSTPLILAVQNKGYFAVKLLLDSKCVIDSTDCLGKAALHYASQMAMGVDMLLRYGADPNICDNDNNTPLLLAATEGFDKVVALLIQANADVNIANKTSKRTPLHILSLKGHSRCIEDLILGGADINLLDSDRRTPLWYATNNNRIKVVKLLLKANSTVDLFQCPKQQPPETCPVKLAFDKCLCDIIKLFIISGYDNSHVKLYLSQYRDMEGYAELSRWQYHSHDVMSLRSMCRLWIRHYLGNMFYHNLLTLPVPDRIRQYLLMKELDEV